MHVVGVTLYICSAKLFLCGRLRNFCIISFCKFQIIANLSSINGLLELFVVVVVVVLIARRALH